MKDYSFFFTERTKFPQDLEKKQSCFTDWTIFSNKFLKKLLFFTKQTIFWMNDFTERLFSEKTNEIDENLR